ncbi:MAG TPA: NAD(P)-dependent oxidoreductase [Candidatus Sphingobacterium stercorigallinarum]|nr:NAD(P)-dependent oxidoreductase [Candidatus Sphingobacterium stercorigallinarum]
MMDLTQLEQRYSEPSAALLHDVEKIDGEVMILGIGGKMGISMGRLLVEAFKKIGRTDKVYGVSRFSDQRSLQQVKDSGVHPIVCDLLDEDQLAGLPEVPNVIFLAGHKFGTTGNEDFTWAMNTYLPGRVADKFKGSRIVAFSSGNVLPFVPLSEGGVDEDQTPEPVGEYAQSCLGRERIFQYFSKKNGTPTLIYRLNYAVDFRYGVLMEIGKAVWEGRPVDLRSQNVNVIWQGDANEMAIRSLLHCTSPAKVLNITGPETLSTRWIAEQFARLFGKTALFENHAAPSALLNNASASHRLFGYPRVTIREVIEINAAWIAAGGEDLGKPTHFQEREGKF